MATTLTDALRAEYLLLFTKMTIRPERLNQVKQSVRKISSDEAQSLYIKVEAATGVPWFVIGIIHSLEASLRFDRHLHNGDPLSARTVHVPAGRPESGSPPFSWDESAIDALTNRGVPKNKDWSLAGIAFILEKYNGFGYRNNQPQVKSPYLWSFTTVYDRGKFVADHLFSPDAVSSQCGGMALLRVLIDSNQSISVRVGVTASSPTVIADPDEDAAHDFPVIDGPPGTDTPDAAVDRVGPVFPGRYLQKGLTQDPDVKVLQKRLTELRADPGMPDGDFGDITEFAVKLFQARSADLAGFPLEIDGVVGPDTWGAMFGPASVIGHESGPVPKPLADQPLAVTAIDVASDEVGVRESPPTSNRGPRVDQYVASVDPDLVPAGIPWCMCFVYFCFKEAARRLARNSPVPKVAGVHTAWDQCRSLSSRGDIEVVMPSVAHANPSVVRPGMVFFIDTGGGHGHAGIVTANINGSLETIEGNTNDNGSREGVGVFRRSKRRVVDISLGFAAFKAI